MSYTSKRPQDAVLGSPKSLQGFTPKFGLKQALWKKHLHGQKKYHAFSFIQDGRIMKEETIEELIDGINYLVYQLIKDRFSKQDILTWNEEKLNFQYLKILEEIKDFSPQAIDKTAQAIAKMRDLIKLLGGIKKENLEPKKKFNPFNNSNN